MDENIMKIPAVVLAAGQGTRLLPVTADTPKPLVKLHDRPIIDYILTNLVYVGFRHFLIVTGYKSETIESWIKDEFLVDIYHRYKKKNDKDLGPLAFSFIRQVDINGTGGATLLTEHHILQNGYSHFFLTYGDILSSKSVYERLIKTYLQEDADVYLVANLTDDPSAGAAVYAENNKLKDFIEKPPNTAPHTNLGNAGIYVFNVKIFNELHSTKPSVRNEIELTAPFKPLIESHEVIQVIKMMEKEFWCDVGTLNVYKKLNNDSNWLKKL